MNSNNNNISNEYVNESSISIRDNVNTQSSQSSSIDLNQRRGGISSSLLSAAATATAAIVSVNNTNKRNVNVIPVYMDISNATAQLSLVKQILKKATTDWLLADEILYLLQFGELTTSQSPVPQCPPNGSVWYYDRRKISDFRKDGYSWKKKKGSSFSVREDHVRLKIGKEARIYGLLHIHIYMIFLFKVYIFTTI